MLTGEKSDYAHSNSIWGGRTENSDASVCESKNGGLLDRRLLEDISKRRDFVD
jgi:hypothetical protein